MSKMNAKWINKDAQSLENDGVNLRVKVDAAGALERTADGLNIKTGGVTNDQLAGSIAFEKLADNANIARLDQDENGCRKLDVFQSPYRWSRSYNRQPIGQKSLC